MRPEDDLDRVLRQAAEHGAGEAAWAQVYGELKAIAARLLRELPHGPSVHPTVVVHEAWLRLAGRSTPPLESRQRFFFTVSRAMRDALVEMARARVRVKRGGGRPRIDLASIDLAAAASSHHVLEVAEAIDRLAAFDDRLARLVELRFFAGLAPAEAAEALEVSLSTVERDWRLARAWLHRELSGDEVQDPELPPLPDPIKALPGRDEPPRRG